MRQPNPKLEVLEKLHELIHSKEDLWREIANLSLTYEYLITEDYYGRVLKELKLVEQHIGEIKEVKELKYLIASLTQSASQPAANHFVA